MALHFDLESTRMCVTPNASEPGSASCEFLATILSVPLHQLRRLHYRHRSYYAYEGATMTTSYLGLNLGAGRKNDFIDDKLCIIDLGFEHQDSS